MSRSRYRPPVSHSHVRRRLRHERNIKLEAIVAGYDERVAQQLELAWWERQRDPTMRGGYSKRQRRYLRKVRIRVALEMADRQMRRWRVVWHTASGRTVGRWRPDPHPGVPCHIGCGCAN